MNWYHNKLIFQDKLCFLVDCAPVHLQVLNYYENTHVRYISLYQSRRDFDREGAIQQTPCSSFSLPNFSERQLRIKVAWWHVSRTGGLRVICNRFLMTSLSLLSPVTGSTAKSIFLDNESPQFMHMLCSTIQAIVTVRTFFWLHSFLQYRTCHCPLSWPYAPLCHHPCYA